ncbi:MAG TPA: protein kinase [Gemmatimonadales bacterium]|jgi:serine/threonine-protein kinase
MTLDSLRQTLAGRYLIERELGQGGMATVYLARDIRHERDVAIKVLRADLSASLGAERFLREIRIAAQLQHPHILPLLDSGSTSENRADQSAAADVGPGQLFFVMPYINGDSLRQRLARETELPVHDALRLIGDVVDALAAAHANGVVHRDIKPDNVMLSGRHALVTDFGVAKAINAAASGVHRPGIAARSSDLTTLGVAVGTPAYMSPEQAAADPHVDHRSDIYSVGVMLYEMLTGQPPFVATTPQQMLAAHITATPAPASQHRPSIAPAIDAIVMRCLEKRPADRFQSASELHAALEACVTPPTGVAPADRRSGLPVNARLTATRQRWWWAAAVIILAAGGAGWRFAQSSRVPPTAGRHTIAVLPIDVKGDTVNTPFADGISDGVRNALDLVPGVTVVGRVSSLAFGASADPRNVRKRIAGVDAVLQGALTSAGLRFHLVAELDDAVDGHQIWGTTADLELRDLYAEQDSIRNAIVSALRLRLTAAPATRAAGRTANPRAYAQYLIGQHEAYQLDERDLRRALAHFDTAIALDPTFAAAYAGSSVAWGYLADEYLPPDSSYDRYFQMARRAVALDSNSAVAHAILGIATGFTNGDLTAAYRELDRAVALDSNSAEVRELYANLLFFDRPDAAVAQADRAIALDPLSGFASFIRAGGLYEGRRYREAITEAQRAQELSPDLVYWDVVDAASYRELGDYAHAVARYREAQRIATKPLFGLGVTYARMGLRDSALRVAHDLEAVSRTRYVTPALIGMIYANLPDAASRDTALAWLGANEHVTGGLNLLFTLAPELDPLRGDPRFKVLLTRSRLSPPAEQR